MLRDVVAGLIVGVLMAVLGKAGVADFGGITSWYAATIAPQVPLRYHTPADPDGLKYHRRLFAGTGLFGAFIAVCAIVAIIKSG